MLVMAQSGWQPPSRCNEIHFVCNVICAKSTEGLSRICAGIVRTSESILSTQTYNNSNIFLLEKLLRVWFEFVCFINLEKLFQIL